ncbi:dihydrofolate reductase [Candidatus Microgenomates bacterium]|nr:dihydrofolate reductase [Candidatus Microgenomates bacterium]
MMLTMVMVQTLNGRITNGSDPNPSTWASPEDQHHFQSLLKDSTVLIMGSTTFDVTPAKTQPKDGKLRVVITRDPKKYSDVSQPEKFEFTDAPLKDVIKDLEQRGHKDALLVGGGTINALFLKEGLVTHLSMTVEPKLFGNGQLVVGELAGLDVNMKLLSCEKVNEQGTLFLRYEVIQ